MHRLLVIDDERAIQHAFRKAFHTPDYETTTADSATGGLALFQQRRPDVVILDVHLPDATGLEALERLKAVDARVPVVLVTGHGTSELAIEAMRRGAFDYLLKPLRHEELHATIARACATSQLMTVPAIVADEAAPAAEADALVGRCPAMHEVYKAIGRVADTNTTVLILGESGVGKELVARAIYQHSARADKPFLAINCGAIPEALVESELFGHVRGAFTGADRTRVGRFEQCNGGTLFLDEIGDMPLLAQVKLLRVLQEKSFERVGGSETLQTDVRVIAASNVDMERRVAEGSFRSDLYFRLNVFTIRIPPLRDRGDDLNLLTDYCIAQACRELRRSVPTVAPETRAALRTYNWPGNVRELQSVLKQALLNSSGSVLLPDALALASRSPSATVEAELSLDWERFVNDRCDAGTQDLYGECLSRMERQVFTHLLARTGGNQVRAAEFLGIARSTLRQKLRALGMSIDRAINSDAGSIE